MASMSEDERQEIKEVIKKTDVWIKKLMIVILLLIIFLVIINI
jgi:hypothetical protein